MLKKIILSVGAVVVGGVLIFGLVFFLNTGLQERITGKTVVEMVADQQQHYNNFKEALRESFSDVE